MALHSKSYFVDMRACGIQITALRDFFGEDNIFIAYGQEKHSACDFDLTNDGTVVSIYRVDQ